MGSCLSKSSEAADDLGRQGKALCVFNVALAILLAVRDGGRE